MPYRNKTFVSFDGDTDIHYYRLMQAWKQSDGIDFNFYDAHDLNTARDSSREESIKVQLAARMRATKIFVLLVGEHTRYLRKFVRWEIEQALRRQLPIIAVNLNGTRHLDDARCPPLLRDELAIHVSFNASIIQHAMDGWSSLHSAKHGKESGPYYYEDSVYKGLGL